MNVCLCLCLCECLLLLIMLYAFQVSWFPRRPIRPSTIRTFHGVLACIDSTPSLCHCLHCESLWIKYAKFIYNTHTRTHTHTPGRGENTPKFCVPRTLDCILRVSFIHVCRYTQLCFSFETVIGSLRWDPQPYTLSIEYWHVLTAHLAFFFIFTVSHSKLNMHSFISHTQLTSVKI